MRQTAFAVVIELDPARARLARKVIEGLQPAELDPVESLHFLSLAIAHDPKYNDLLIFDVVCDGRPGFLWPAIVDRLGGQLLELLGHTIPRRGTGVKLPPRTRADIAAYLERHTVFPAALHHGNRGMTRRRILSEAKLARDTEIALEALLATPDGRALDAAGLQRALRGAAGNPVAPPSRYTWWERLRLRIKNPTTALAIAASLLLAAVAVAVWSVYELLEALAPSAGRIAIDAGCWLMVVAGIAIGALYWQLRRLERTDQIKADPQVDPALRTHLRKNDPGTLPNTVQNHLVAVVSVKPGTSRTVVLWLVLFVLKYKILIENVNGYLQTMRTIHFIQWNMIENGGRVVFMSNYDGTWDSYLDDFTEKANEGLTAGWTNCIGFPETRNLVRGGAASGDEFKRWTLQWQHRTLFTYRGYPMLTVDRIERNAEIAAGLYAPSLSGDAALAWAQRL